MLDYFYNCQRVISTLQSDQLLLCDGGLSDSKGVTVLKFSQKTLDNLSNLKSKGYTITSAKVNFVVIWKKTNEEKEIRIVLPEIFLKGA